MKKYVISIGCKVTIKAEDAASAMSQAKNILEDTGITYVTSIAPLSERSGKDRNIKEFVILIVCQVTIKANDAASAMNGAKEKLENTGIAYVTSIAPLSEKEM